MSRLAEIELEPEADGYTPQIEVQVADGVG